MPKHVQFDDEARNALRRGVNQLASAVRVTLGPRGRNVVVDRGAGMPTITNDGFTVANEIELADRFENMGVQLLKEAAQRTGAAAGDGTTTATVLAQSLVEHGLRAVAAGHAPTAIRRGIERAVAEVVGFVAELSRPVRGRADLERIATVSARGDSELGGWIAEALDRVGRSGVVTVEEGRGLSTTLEVLEGVRIEGGYLSPYFITDPEAMECALEGPLVLLVDARLTGARDLLPALEHAAAAGRPLFVVAEDVEGDALAMLVVNRLRGSLSSVAIKAPGVGERRRELLDDLALLTGASVIAADLGLGPANVEAEHLGNAKRVLVEREHTTLIGGGGQPAAVQIRVGGLERAIGDAESEVERQQLRERLGRLTGGVGVLRVGGATEPEMKDRKARIEDSLAATRAAVEEGVVPGGGVALLRARACLDRLQLGGDADRGVEIVREALAEPARQIARNAGAEGEIVVARILEERGATGWNALTGVYEDLLEAGILDPAKVVRVALQSAASIAALVLTTDAMVVEDDDEGPEAN